MLPNKQKAAISKINKRGALLVFPIKNRKEPASLWSEFYPRKKMRWEWNDNGDDSVAQLWYLMKKLSDSRQVVYSKWYQGRATFFSRELFTALLCLSLPQFENPEVSHSARDLLDCLESDSPLSTKQLKELTDMRGKANEPAYNRGMKELFSKFLVVAFGEVDDGAFPSLAVGATKNLFEDLLIDARVMSATVANKILERFLPTDNPFRKQFEKLRPLDPETPPLKRELVEKLEKIPGLKDRPSKVAGGSAIFYRDKEIAHFHHDSEIDVRLTKKIIKQENLGQPVDSKVHKPRSPSSEWIELRFTNPSQVDEVVRLFKLAVKQY